MTGAHQAPRTPLSARAKGAWSSAVIAVTAGLYSLIAGSPAPHATPPPPPSDQPTTGSIPRIRTDLPPKTSVFVKASPSGSAAPIKASAAPAPVKTTPPPATRKPSPIASVAGSATRAARVVAFLRAQLGKSYVLGGNGPGSYDCSGLVVAAFRTVGVSMPRTSEQQASAGVPVSLHNLQPGDILFWGSPAGHSAVYVGGGMFIGAENPALGVVERPLTWDRPSYARRVL